jgi:hypothetical protein
MSTEIKIMAGVQTDWPSGTCHLCRSLFEDIIKIKDRTYPMLTMKGVKAPIPEDKDFVLCCLCVEAIQVEFRKYSKMITEGEC